MLDLALKFVRWRLSQGYTCGQSLLSTNSESNRDSSMAITKRKTPVPVCSPKLSPVGQGCYLDG